VHPCSKPIDEIKINISEMRIFFLSADSFEASSLSSVYPSIAFTVHAFVLVEPQIKYDLHFNYIANRPAKEFYKNALTSKGCTSFAYIVKKFIVKPIHHNKFMQKKEQ